MQLSLQNWSLIPLESNLFRLILGTSFCEAGDCSISILNVLLEYIDLEFGVLTMEGIVFPQQKFYDQCD